jgi:uncharacterized protein YlzI (FlbEa/FlbD family)
MFIKVISKNDEFWLNTQNILTIEELGGNDEFCFITLVNGVSYIINFDEQLRNLLQN